MAEPASRARRGFVDWAQHNEALIQLYGEGKSAREIAKALGGGCTRNAIIGRIHRLGLQRDVHPAHAGKGVAGPRKRVLQVPGLAGGTAAKARDGKRAPDKTVLLERMRQKTNFDSGTTRARLEARHHTVPADQRFVEGYHGQAGRVALVDLHERHCRYPITQTEGPVKYCGLQKREGSSYCAEHHARCCDGIPSKKEGAQPLRLPAFNGVAA